MPSASSAFDAVSLGIMWDRLVSLTDEIVSTLVRSSFSTIGYESYDFSCVVLDAEGSSVLCFRPRPLCLPLA